MIRKITEPVYQRAIESHSRDWWTVTGPGAEHTVGDYRWRFVSALMQAAELADADDLQRIKDMLPEWSEWEQAGIEAERKDIEEAQRVAMNKGIQDEYRERDKDKMHTQEQKYTNKRDFQPKGMQ